MRMQRRRLLVLALVVMAAVAPAAADADDRPNWHDKSLYPAKVELIGFGKERRITSETYLTWGAWSVHFPYFENPVARVTQNDDAFFVVSVEGLRCENSVAGTKSCFMGLSYQKRWKTYSCYFWPADENLIEIHCPKRLVFAK